MCVQKPDEPLRDYITRWIELWNSCEGVHEVQAIQYFIEAYRDDTLLKQQAHVLRDHHAGGVHGQADKYATADSAMRRCQRDGQARPAAPRENRGLRDKQAQVRLAEPTTRSKQVATVEEEQPAAQAVSQRQRAVKAPGSPAHLRADAQRALQDAL
ncbi:Endoglucanase 3 [Hordeum vulgare]|nr:Endoglucanase 3 [Hordeum vulgare]